MLDLVMVPCSDPKREQLKDTYYVVTVAPINVWDIGKWEDLNDRDTILMARKLVQVILLKWHFLLNVSIM